MYPTLFWQHFHVFVAYFHKFSENVLQAWAGSTILKIDIKHFNEKSYFFAERHIFEDAHASAEEEN